MRWQRHVALIRMLCRCFMATLIAVIATTMMLPETDKTHLLFEEQIENVEEK